MHDGAGLFFIVLFRSKKIISCLKTSHFLLTSDPNIDILIQSQRGFIFTGLWF